jgi:hypothetical protein
MLICRWKKHNIHNNNKPPSPLTSDGERNLFRIILIPLDISICGKNTTIPYAAILLCKFPLHNFIFFETKSIVLNKKK